MDLIHSASSVDAQFKMMKTFGYSSRLMFVLANEPSLLLSVIRFIQYVLQRKERDMSFLLFDLFNIVYGGKRGYMVFMEDRNHNLSLCI